MSEISPKRRKLAKMHSADAVINPVKEEAGKKLEKVFGSLSDVGIEATGFSRLIEPTMKCIRQKGRLVLQGYYPEPICFNCEVSNGRHLTIFCPSGWRGMEGLKKALNLIKSHAVRIRPLMPKKYKPEDAPVLYKNLKEDRGNVLAVYFEWSG